MQLMTRRSWIVLLTGSSPNFRHGSAQIGDDEWMRRFREFVKRFNAAVNALNDGSFDVSRWRRMQTDWRKP